MERRGRQIGPLISNGFGRLYRSWGPTLGAECTSADQEIKAGARKCNLELGAKFIFRQIDVQGSKILGGLPRFWMADPCGIGRSIVSART